MTDQKLGVFAAKAEVLRIAADRAERVKNVFTAKFRRALNDCVRMENATFSELDVIAHHGICADLNTRGEFGAGGNDGVRMNLRRAHFTALVSGTRTGVAESRSTILHMSVASAASCPSTVARPSSLQKSPRHDRTFTSSFN